VDNITLIGAIASVISLAIQILNFFPNLGRIRGYLVATSGGFFVGSFIRTLESSSLMLNVEFTFGAVFLSITGFLTIGFLLMGAFNSHSRDDFWSMAFLLLLVFLFGSVAIFGLNDKEEQLTISELNYLAERAIDNKDISRAVIHLREIEIRVRADEELHSVILERIQVLRRRELE